MATEIERKYLVDTSVLGELKQGITIKQAYVSTIDKTVVRVRVTGVKAFLTLKGENKGMTRSEFEYEIPIKDAEQMIDQLCSGPIIDKTRYVIQHANHMWEVDFFHGDNEGLVVAEIELKSENEVFDLPAWVSEEVTGDVKYYNSNLLLNPYNKWEH